MSVASILMREEMITMREITELSEYFSPALATKGFVESISNDAGFGRRADFANSTPLDASSKSETRPLAPFARKVNASPSFLTHERRLNQPSA